LQDGSLPAEADATMVAAIPSLALELEPPAGGRQPQCETGQRGQNPGCYRLRMTR